MWSVQGINNPGKAALPGCKHAAEQNLALFCSMSTIATLVLKSGRDRALLNRHPWIFSGAVKTLPKAEDGDIVRVSDNHDKTLGFGYFSPRSQIICRVFHFGATAEDFQSVHYWQQKFQAAWDIRQQLVAGEETTCFRLIHAEGDFMPGVICDVYGKTAVLQLLIQGTARRKDLIVACLQTLGIESVYFKSKTSSAKLENIREESRWLAGKGEEQIAVLEHGLKFSADPVKGQKTGFFIDQRENRQLLRELSAGKRVLNTFCYTGGFSVYALAGGATEVVSVDISKQAIALCEETVALNFGAEAKHSAIAADCFEYLRQEDTGEAFDIIVLDPPAFAKNARSVPNASRGYKDLNLLAMQQIKPGGLLMTYSCSQNISKDLFQKIVFGAAADAGRNVRIIQHLGQPHDHPVNIFHPESEYLKGLLLWVE